MLVPNAILVNGTVHFFKRILHIDKIDLTITLYASYKSDCSLIFTIKVFISVSMPSNFLFACVSLMYTKFVAIFTLA
ncbi:hypothetical protein QIA25_05385 (plasmid) [Borreliella spielmanii]|uniref:hypothetical protein n=1 Tax=Borreliella spielmanii TaxID=88916 RepID=UPI002410489A|nr:hypothetical protein [Borreliella spielmanii]